MDTGWQSYDIGDGRMDWQIRAKNSLFYTKYGSYETRATGMLLVCQEDKREEVAENIIWQTMWSRKQLLKDHCAERSRPARWSRSPIMYPDANEAEGVVFHVY